MNIDGFSDEKGHPDYWLNAVRDFWNETGLNTDETELYRIVKWFDERRKSDETITIYGEIFSDDYKHHFDFDATPWFEQATFDKVQTLINCGFAGKPAMNIAKFVNQNEINLLLESYQNNDTIGAQCVIDEDGVWEWLRKFRPWGFPTE